MPYKKLGKGIKLEFKTSRNRGHKHEFIVGQMLTKKSAMHVHPINYRTGVALPVKGHMHTHTIPKLSRLLYKVLKNKI